MLTRYVIKSGIKISFLIFIILLAFYTFRKLPTEIGIPTFDDYPAEEISVETPHLPKPIDGFGQFHPFFEEEVKEGVNFAGEYRLISWEYTPLSHMIAVFNTSTGESYIAPFTVQTGSEFYPNSRLFIGNPPDTITEKFPDNIPKWVETRYYIWEDGMFKIVENR